MLKKEVARMLGIKASTIALYADRGIITPDISNPKGKGGNRLYSVRNLVEILLIKLMVEAGITHARIKQIMQWVNGACSPAPPEICADSLGYDALDPFDPGTLDRYTFLIIYNDNEGLNFELVWRENKKDTAELPVDMQRFQTAKVISITPLVDKARALPGIA